MEAAKLLVDIVVYAVFYMMLSFYLFDWRFTKNRLRKGIAIVCYVVTMICMWIYTYAVIGYAVDELIWGD